MPGYEISEEVLDRPMYTAAEAGRLVGLSSNRVRRWLQGYSYEYDQRKRRQLPVIKRNESDGTSYATFLELIDLLFVKRFLDYGLSLQKIRKALDEAACILNTSSFAHQIFFTDGKRIYLEIEKAKKEEDAAILELLSGRQWVIPQVIEELAHQIEKCQTTKLARRWYPLGRNGLIVLDPFVSFGRPAIIGKGVATSNVYDFFVAEGRKSTSVCSWLDLTKPEVEAAVKFEEEQLAA